MIAEICARCGENPATENWVGSGGALALVHGMSEWWCERCVVEVQTVHARERASELPGLERRLEELGGPAKATCSCVPALLTKQTCPVHGEIDYGERYIEANVAAGIGTREELEEDIGRGPGPVMEPPPT